MSDKDPFAAVASNNPAVTVPATQHLQHDLSHQHYRRPHSDDTLDVTDPSGASLSIPSSTEPPLRPPTKYDHGWRRIVRNFSPSWFSVTMGTGIVSILFITIPYPSPWLYYLSLIFFCLNTLLFALAFALSIARYTLYPAIFRVMLADATNSLFLGTVPMGFATLVEMWIFVCVPAWGPWATTVAFALWILCAAASITVTLALGILTMSSEHQTSLDRITAGQLLPIAATIVAAGTGAEVAEILPDPQHALGTLVASYVMWGMGVPLALAVLVMYYQRLALHKLPPREVIVSCFLPLGPLGMGGYTIMYLGKVSRSVFASTHVFPTTTSHANIAGDVVYILGFFVALIMWGFGLVWFVFALATIAQARPFPFNMGWWGFTFPLGVYAVSTITIGVEMPSRFFRVLGVVLSVAVILLWVVVAAGTARGAWSGKLFYAPCLANLKEEVVVVVEGGGEKAP